MFFFFNEFFCPVLDSYGVKMGMFLHYISGGAKAPPGGVWCSKGVDGVRVMRCEHYSAGLKHVRACEDVLRLQPKDFSSFLFFKLLIVQ